MAKLDFNAIKRPTLELTMKDKKHTIIDGGRGTPDTPDRYIRFHN